MPFGYIAAAVSAVSSVAAEVVGAGIVADAIGAGIVGAGIGGVGGALVSGVTGGNPLEGFESGALIGLGAGAGGAACGVLGASLGGAAGGALGAEATGTNPLTGALEGGVAGGISGVVSGSSLTGPAGAAITGPAETTAGAAVDPSQVGVLGASQTGTVLAPQTPDVGGGGTASPPVDLGSVAPAPGGAGGPSVLASGGGAPVLTGAGADAPTGSTPLSLSPGSNLSGPEAGLQADVAGQGANPASTATSSNLLQTDNALSQAGAQQSGMSSGAKLALAAAPAALSLLKGQPAVPSNIEPLTTTGSVTGPLISTEQQQLNEGNTGVLQPGQAAQVAQYGTQSEAALRQQLVNEGVTNPTADSRYIAGMATINQNQQIMAQLFVTAALTSGLSAAGDATTALTTAANAQIAVDNQFQSALNSAMTSFGLIEGFSKAA